jgi:MoaA/NifB/PqqE/SkfB family radical SAM enzyme
MSNIDPDDILLNDLQRGFWATNGPEIVQFDITNRCNNNCLCCWNNSPLLGNLAPLPEWKNQELPVSLVKKTIKDLAQMGTKTLFFAGGGEPFMHPDLMEILTEAKSHGLKVVMNTNFTLVNEEMISRMVDLKIDFIHASILAGSPEIYTQIHPNKTLDDFERIKHMLFFLADIKDQKKALGYKPHLNMYYVVFNRNFHEITQMVNLALWVRASSLEFAPIDIIPGATESLLLNKEQIAIVVRDLKMQNKILKEKQKAYPNPITFIEQYDSFLSRITNKNAVHGQYGTLVNNLKSCYAGWKFSRIAADGNVYPCLKANKIIVGNIYNGSFPSIWNGVKQMLFREKTLRFDKNDPYFQGIGNNAEAVGFGCNLICDNITINLDMERQYGEHISRPWKK